MILNKSCLELTRIQIRNALLQFDIKPKSKAEIEALLSIPSDPFWVLPLILDIVSRDSLWLYYGQCVGQISESLSLTDGQRLYLLVPPKVRKYIADIDPTDSDVHYADEIDNLIGFDCIQEKIATQYAIGLKGGLYSAMAAGASMYDYPHFHESFLHMPVLAMKSLSKAIEKLYSPEAVSQLSHIQKHKPAILKEARIKLILGLYSCGANVIELITHVYWLELFHPNDQRWNTVKKHHHLISQMTTP